MSEKNTFEMEKIKIQPTIEVEVEFWPTSQSVECMNSAGARGLSVYSVVTIQIIEDLITDPEQFMEKLNEYLSGLEDVE